MINPILLENSTATRKAELDMPKIRKLCGLPDDAEIKLIPDTDATGNFKLHAAWIERGAVAAAEPPPASKPGNKPARGQGAAPKGQEAVAKPDPTPQPAPVGTANNGSDTDDDTP